MGSIPASDKGVKMDKSELAKLMLEWEALADRLAAVEQQIVEAVLVIGETVTVGNVAARYRKGAVKKDYEAVGKAAPAEIIARHTKIETSVSWAKVCADAGLEAPVVDYGQDSVRVTKVTA